ncbi:MAG: hypothetical protein CMM31_02815 [Rhodospirillaceae bacterium]|nr:hypothetical protein [Rhodospirillaceae bacterium]
MRREDVGQAELFGIGALARRRFRVREQVLPPEIVPIVDMEFEAENVVAFLQQFAEEGIRRRAGGAALRG